MSFRRERYVPRGGPDGGDGGRGGDVRLEADPAMLVLDDLRRTRNVRAEPGGHGTPADRHGRRGKDVVLKVPLGTMVWNVDGGQEQIADLTVPGQRVAVAKGGAGGRGNARFATATRRAPGFAERGLPGDRVRLRLELRLLAEVGLVGLPNAGKSSLLRAVSAARPKVGAYPFTTLEPNIGVVEFGYDRVAFADIPGLIEGAHEGAGLGVDFLQHIRRTRVLVHVVDMTQDGALEAIDIVRGELGAFGQGLAARPWLAALNKIDLPEGRERGPALAQKLHGRGVEAYAVSACTGEGVDALLAAVCARVATEREAAAAAAEPPVMRVTPPERSTVRKVKGGFEVLGRRPREAVLKLGTDSDEARAELVSRLRRLGVVRALARAGAKTGDRVSIGDAVVEWPL